MSKKILFLGDRENTYHPLSEFKGIFESIAREIGAEILLTTDKNYLRMENIMEFNLIISSLTESKITKQQSEGLREAIIGNPWGRIGKPINFIGIHGVTTSFKGEEWYYRMLGARFLTHPQISSIEVIPVKNHTFTRNLEKFELKDELYMMEYYPPFQTLLYTIHNAIETPLAWIKNYGLGRVFYFAPGHSRKTFEEPNVKKLISSVIRDFVS